MRTLRLILVLIATVLPSIALAAGYGPWEFGMTKQQVRNVTQFGPYYEFGNGDLGTKAGVLDEGQAPVSFYFKDERLVRIMVVVYSGSSFDETMKAWRRTFQHIERHFQAVEVPSIKLGATDLPSAERALEASGLRDRKDGKVQMAPTPMPKDRAVWSTVDIVPTVGYWVALNYAEPPLATGQPDRLIPSSPVDAVALYVIPTDGIAEQSAADIARALTRDTGLWVKASLWAPSGVDTPFAGTNQYPADDYLPLGQLLSKRLPDAGPRTYFIVVTNRDINSRSQNFRFQYSMHSPMTRTSVLSLARLAYEKDGSLSPPEVVTTRTAKMLFRIVGEMKLGWTRNTEPTDLMYSPIMSIDDIDRMSLSHTLQTRVASGDSRSRSKQAPVSTRLKQAGLSPVPFRGRVTLRSTGRAGSCFDLLSSSARRAGYLNR